MGLTFCNLYIPAACEAALEKHGAAGDVLRRGTPGWIGILPGEDEPFENALKRLRRIANAAGEPCLLFIYSDDDDFDLSLLQGRKTMASVTYSIKPTKVAGFDFLLPNGNEDAKKLKKLASGSLKEALNLLEETFGLPFYDYQPLSPRAVKRGDAAWKALLAREAALKKRRNQYNLELVPPEDWPEDIGFTYRMLSCLKQAGEMSRFVGGIRFDRKNSIGPYGFVISGGWKNSKQIILRYDDRDGSLTRIPDVYNAEEIISASDDGAPICMLSGVKQIGLQYVAKLCPDGTLEWLCHPNADNDAPDLHCCCVLPDGSVVAYSREAIWRVSPSDGRILQSVSYPKDEQPLSTMRYCTQLGRFLTSMGQEYTLKLLDEDLRVVKVWDTGKVPFDPCGPCDQSGIWMTYREPVYRLDFQTGEIRKVRPEVSGLILNVFSDGVLASVSESSMRTLSLLSPVDGSVVFRHTFDGCICGLTEWNGEKYALEFMGSSMAFISLDLLLSVRVWKLMPK